MTNEATGNPYVGPPSFTEAQSHLFFGREREARDLCARVLSEKLVLFYAQSGAGKSSLINTRLIPQLRKFDYAVLPVARVSGELPAGVTEVDNVYLFNLMLSLDMPGRDPGRFAHMQLTHFLAGLSSEDGRRFVYEEVLEPVQQAEDQSGSAMRYVLVIDQFEELITSNPTHWRKREEFFRQLNQAMVDDPKLWVVLSFREDFLAPIETYAALMTDRMRARFYMGRMDYAAALEAVKEPAKLAGRPFDENVAETLVTNLCQIRVLGQTETQTGQYVAPVQLQVVCYQLWEKLKRQAGDKITAQDLRQAGNVDNALADFYNQAIAKVLNTTGASEIELRRWFEKKLITEANTRGTVYKDVVDTAGLENLVVKALEDQCLIQPEIRAGGTWYELVHDRFIDPVKQANKDWFQQNETPLQLQAALWEKEGKPDSLLLQGEALESTEQSPHVQHDELDDLEREFLGKSRDKAEREKEVAERREAEQARDLAEAKQREAEALAEANRREAEQAQALAEVNRLRAEQESASNIRLHWAFRWVVVCSILALVGGAYGAWQYFERDKLQKQAVEQEKINSLTWLRDLPDEKHKKQHGETIFNNIASYLWINKETKKLVDIMVKAEDLIRETYGKPEMVDWMPIDPDTEWPLTFEVNPTRGVNRVQLKYWWSRFAPQVSERFGGVPVPVRVKINEDSEVKANQIRIVGLEDEVTVKELSPFPGRMFLSERPKDTPKEISPELINFLREFKSKWKPVKELSMGSYLWVPDWSLPILKAGGYKDLFSEEMVIASSVAEHLKEKPELVLTEECIEHLLDDLKFIFPNTVAEVIKSRGGASNIRNDLVQWAREDHLKSIPFVLNTLANYPLDSSENESERSKTVKQAIADISALGTRPPQKLQRKPVVKKESQDESQQRTDFEGYSLAYAESKHQAIHPPIRIYLGEGITPYIFDRGQRRQEEPEKIKLEVSHKIREQCDSIFEKFGVKMPLPKLFPDDSLDPHSFRIEIENQIQTDPLAQPIKVEPERAVERIIEEVAWRGNTFRTFWLTTESVNELVEKELGEEIRKWLTSQFSMTDIKLILRSVVAPNENEVTAYINHEPMDAGWYIEKEQTLQNIQWLLCSLPFWLQFNAAETYTGLPQGKDISIGAESGKQKLLSKGGTSLLPRKNVTSIMRDDRLNLNKLMQNLRDTQRGRIDQKEQGPADAQLMKLIESGIKNIELLKIASAMDLFKKSIEIDKDKARGAFLAVYSRRHQIDYRPQFADLQRRYPFPKAGMINETSWNRPDMRDYVEEIIKKGGSAIDAKTRRMIDLYMLLSFLDEWRYSLKENHFVEADALIKKLIGEKGQRTPQEEYFLAYSMLQTFKDNVKAPEHLRQIQELMNHAFKKLKSEDAERAFRELYSSLFKERRATPMWRVALLSSLVEIHPQSFLIPFQMGAYLASKRYSQKELEFGFGLLDRAQKNLSRIELDDQRRHRAWLDYYRALIFKNLSYYKAPANQKQLNQAYDLLTKIKNRVEDDEGWPALDSIYQIALIDLETEKIGQSMSVVEDGLYRFPHSDDLLFLKFFLTLAEGDVNKSLKMARDHLAKLTKYDRNYHVWFLYSTMLQLVTRKGDYENDAQRYLDTSYDDQDYVRIMLYWALCMQGREAEGKEILVKRWLAINPLNWPDRLEQGDKNAWSEMLLSYYAGKIGREEVFGPLEDRNSFEKSKLTMIGETFLGFQCDYFYDALFQEVSGNPDDRQNRALKSLEKVVEARQPTYFEYHLARYLIDMFRSPKK